MNSMNCESIGQQDVVDRIDLPIFICDKKE